MDQVVVSLKEALIEALTEARATKLHMPNKPIAQAYINSKIEVLESMVVFLDKSIKEGEIDMKKLKTEIKTIGSGSLEDLMIATRGGQVEPRLLEIAKGLKPNTYEAIDPQTISWAHFSGRVYAMRKRGQLGEDYLPVKRGDKFFLVRRLETEAKPKGR